MLKTKEEIKDWLDKHKVKKYIIHDDLTVDVAGGVHIHGMDLKEIPVQFGIVYEDFFCGDNSLTSLKGCPYKVGRTFHCAVNNLTSLEGCPKIVGEVFNCLRNPIKSLLGFDTKIGNKFLHSCLVEDFEMKELDTHYEDLVDTDLDDKRIRRISIDGKDIKTFISYVYLENILPNNNENKAKKIKI
jgi:hypothetical protein